MTQPKEGETVGQYPIHAACSYGHGRIVARLLHRGADLKAVNVAGKKASQEATGEALQVIEDYKNYGKEGMASFWF